jgi:subtilisin family serine protease
MKVPEAWLLADGSASVVIAIIDTGIDTDHEEFTGRILPNSYNARTKETSTTSLDHIEDDNGHGTMVAGIIAANKNNNKGIAGIVSESSLLIIKANNADNLSTPEDESKEFSDSVIAEGIHYAREQGADIINLSLGSTTQNTIVKNAVTEAQHAGIIIVGASGNDGVSTKYYPASYPGVVSVGSIDETLTISSFSNYNDAV